MTDCPSCGETYRPGTLFCNRCGIYLPTGEPLGAEVKSPSPKPTPHREVKSSTSQPAEGSSTPMKIEVQPTGHRIQLPDKAEALIGRPDEAGGVTPDIDLTPHRGLELGVSRRHCKIYQRGGTYFIEDVGSSNGTFLNGKRLTPHKPQAIQKGDVLQLGGVKLKVTL